MKIAILGWGSLIWDPRNLQIDKTIGQNGWLSDGPMLPIEFARISKYGRLTLVITEGKEKVQTLFAMSKFIELEKAIDDLSKREGCLRNQIGFLVKSNRRFHSKSNIRNNIESWINQKDEIDAVIWTDLSMNFEEKLGFALTEDSAFNYLKHLPSDIKVEAEQYFRRAPMSIDTVIRRKTEAELGWISERF